MSTGSASKQPASRPFGAGTRYMAIVGFIAFVVSAMPTSAWAIAVTEAYIFSDWSSPSNVTGVPFTLDATSGYRLNLNGSGVATSATLLSGPLSVGITNSMRYVSHTGTINSGETFSGTMESRVNSEIALVDDSGLIQDGVPDAALNIDFSRGSTVTLRTSPSAISVPGLILFEDAGLDPFSLRYCTNDSCTSSVLLFNGWNSSTQSTLTSNPNRFGSDDYAPGIDQAFWFIFDGPVAGGYFKIGDTVGNPGGTRLEVDFVGVTAGATRRVPEPSTLLLLGAGLVGLPLVRKLRAK